MYLVNSNEISEILLIMVQHSDILKGLCALRDKNGPLCKMVSLFILCSLPHPDYKLTAIKFEKYARSKCISI